MDFALVGANNAILLEMLKTVYLYTDDRLDGFSPQDLCDAAVTVSLRTSPTSTGEIKLAPMLGRVNCATGVIAFVDLINRDHRTLPAGRRCLNITRETIKKALAFLNSELDGPVSGEGVVATLVSAQNRQRMPSRCGRAASRGPRQAS